MPLPVREGPRQLTRRAFGRGQRGVDHPLPHAWGNPVPIAPGDRRPRGEPVQPTLGIPAIPRVEGRPRHLQLAQRVAYRQVRPFHQTDHLLLLRRRQSHVSSSEPEAVTVFLSSRFSSTISATSCFRSVFSLRRSLTSVDRRLAGHVADEPLLAGFEKLLAPAVIQIRRQALLAAQRGDAFFAPQALQHDPNLLFGRKPSAGLPPDLLNDLLR